LQELTAAEAVQLLIRIASLREQTELVSFLKTPMGKARVQAVEHLAGGNPRIYVIFAEFLSRESLEELVQPFMALLDALTPYYQSRMQYLSAQQREIVEFLCDRKFPATVKDIAQRCFITSQTTSSQLKELKEKGYVNVESIGRESFYALQEPLMRICLGMKKERDSTLNFMVDFLRAWYSKAELDMLHQQMMKLKGFAPKYLELALRDSNTIEQDPRIAICLEQMKDFYDHGPFDEALHYTQKLLTIRGSAEDWIKHTFTLAALERYQEAITSCDNALAIESENYIALQLKEILPSLYESILDLATTKKNTFYIREKLLYKYEKYLELLPNDLSILAERANLLLRIDRWEEGAKSIKDILNQLQQSNESYPGDIEIVLNELLTQDSSQWRTKITDLINWFEPFPTAVTNGLVSACIKLILPLISDTTATLWHDTWHELTHDRPEYQLPLRLLTTALHYKQKPADPRVWMELSIEERKILQQALGIESEVL
jgi:tetratricopeptide (TPR) repeat protein